MTNLIFNNCYVYIFEKVVSAEKVNRNKFEKFLEKFYYFLMYVKSQLIISLTSMFILLTLNIKEFKI